MGDKTKIQWTDASWNPIRARNLKTGKVGWFCTHASEGCRNCYSEGFNVWRGNGLPYKPGHLKDVEIFIDENILKLPVGWKRPRMIFVCSMTDLFAEWHTDEMLDRIFAVMAIAREHAFQVLTKRPDRAMTYLKAKRPIANVEMCWPLPNVWMGISAEDQANYDERWKWLAATPAAVRFVSYEPAIGPLSFRAGPTRNPDWVIVGGESGKGARPFDIGWARDMVIECRAHGVACFVKQLGAKPYDGDFCEVGEDERVLPDELRTRITLKDGKGGDIEEWPEDIKVREYPV